MTNAPTARRSARATHAAALAAGLLATLGATRPLAAQGSLSMQGYGYPTGELSLSIDSRLASGQGTAAALLHGGGQLPIHREGDRLRVTVPRLDRYEVVRF